MMGRGIPGCWAAAAACGALLVGAGAGAANVHLEQARAAYEQLDYDKVTPLLEQALAGPTTDEDEVAIFELLGLIHVTYGRDAEAQQAFVELLKRRPGYALPADSSPKIVSVFRQAQEDHARLKAARPVERPTERPAATPGALPVAGDQRLQPGTEPARPADDERGAGAEGGAFYQQWWFWTGTIAAVGTSSVVAGVLVWYLTRPEVPETDFGPYPLK